MTAGFAVHPAALTQAARQVSDLRAAVHATGAGLRTAAANAHGEPWATAQALLDLGAAAEALLTWHADQWSTAADRLAATAHAYAETEARTLDAFLGLAP